MLTKTFLTSTPKYKIFVVDLFKCPTYFGLFFRFNWNSFLVDGRYRWCRQKQLITQPHSTPFHISRSRSIGSTLHTQLTFLCVSLARHLTPIKAGHHPTPQGISREKAVRTHSAWKIAHTTQSSHRATTRCVRLCYWRQIDTVPFTSFLQVFSTEWLCFTDFHRPVF